MLRNVLRPIGGTNQVISQLTSRVAFRAMYYEKISVYVNWSSVT